MNLALIILLVDTVILIYLIRMVYPLYKYREMEDYLNKKEEQEIASKIKVYGSFENLLREDPVYIASGILRKFKMFRVNKNDIDEFMLTFLAASLKNQEIMFNNQVSYIFSNLDKKKQWLIKFQDKNKDVI